MELFFILVAAIVVGGLIVRFPSQAFGLLGISIVLVLMKIYGPPDNGTVVALVVIGLLIYAGLRAPSPWTKKDDKQ